MPVSRPVVSVLTLCLFLCACERHVDDTVSSPQTSGSPSVQTANLRPSTRNTSPPTPGNVKDKTLPDFITKALATYDPEFHTWTLAAYPSEKLALYPYSEKSLPYAVFGDYNGDGMEDVVLAGHNKHANIIVALMATATGYYAIEVQKKAYYVRTVEQRKNVPYTADGILLFQRKGGQYVAGDTQIQRVVLKTDGFAVQHMRWFNHETSEFGFSGLIAYVYEWDSAISNFHPISLEEEAATHIAKYALRTDFTNATFEEPTSGRRTKGASSHVAVKSPSGEWVVQKPLRITNETVYYEVPIGTELKTTYSCVPIDPYGVKYWKVGETRAMAPLNGNRLDPGCAIAMPNPVVSRVLQVGTAFGYYWRVPNCVVEITKEAALSYACEGGKLTTVFTVTDHSPENRSE